MDLQQLLSVQQTLRQVRDKLACMSALAASAQESLNRGDREAAMTSIRRALSIEPAQVEFHYLLGMAHEDLESADPWRRFALRQRHLERALRIAPGFEPAVKALCRIALYRGDLRTGWHAFGISATAADEAKLLGTPRWKGEPLAGKRIFLNYGRQFGTFGETLMHIRFVGQLVDAGATVIIYAHETLRRLLASARGVSEIYQGGDIPRHDYHITGFDLPLYLGPTIETIPPAPYLTADPPDVAAWRARLAAYPGLRVGLVWAGNPPILVTRERNMRLADLAPFAEVEGVTFFSLQKGPPAAEIAAPPPRLNLVDLAPDLVDWAATAACVQNLDVVIAPDTAVVHLTGAVGRPVWMMDRKNHCWRWLPGREDSYWYGTMRIFRQTTLGDWTEPIARAAEELRKLADQPR